MRKKLKQNSGETLVEALISLLIIVLSMGFLATTVLVASNINAENRKNDKEYAKQLYDAEGLVVENPDVAKVKIDFSNSLIADESADITLYGGETNDFVSYEEVRNSEEENSEGGS